MTSRMIFHPVEQTFDHTPGRSTAESLRTQVRNCMQRYADERMANIKKYEEENPDLDHLTASINYDMQHAPFTTNHEMLVLGCGITVVPPLTIQADHTILIEHLANAFAALNIFFLNHNHLDDRTLYDLMWKATQEEVRFLPPCDGVYEYINLEAAAPSKNPNTDRVLPTSNQDISWHDTQLLPTPQKGTTDA